MVIQFNDYDWRVVAEFTSLTVEFNIIKYEQLIPCRTESLTEDLKFTLHTFMDDSSIGRTFISKEKF